MTNVRTWKYGCRIEHRRLRTRSSPREGAGRKRTAWAWIVPVLVALCFAVSAAGQNKNQLQLRELAGTVLDHQQTPIENAMVYLKNTKTLAVKTFITGKDGRYRFPALAQNIDYEVYAKAAAIEASPRPLAPSIRVAKSTSIYEWIPKNNRRPRSGFSA